jgi:hypothetical protein
VNDVQGSGSSSGGLPIPNPDTIYEFKVQTGLNDASYGRFGGANVSVITKAGSNAYHGAIFEFFRNDALNANDFFLNGTSQPRPALRQNQFGVTLGGPILKDKLFFFGSYQGTRQVNGLAAGQARIACTASVSMPPLATDRSPLKRESDKIRILLADDHTLFYSLLRDLLEAEYEVVGSVSDGQELVKTALSLRPDVVPADIGMPSLNAWMPDGGSSWRIPT